MPALFCTIALVSSSHGKGYTTRNFSCVPDDHGGET
jgi:hypothetical protein